MNNKVLPLVLIISLLACCIEVEISIPGFVEMAHTFNVTEFYIQLTLVFNLIGFAMGSIIYGPLSDSFGRRPIMLLGNFILWLGALGCVASPSLEWMYISRLIQGFGAATSAVVVFAIIADRYSSEQSVKILSILNAVFTIFMAGAPILGSLVNHHIGWRGNYAFVAGLCGLSCMIICLYLPETHKDKHPFSFSRVKKNYIRLIKNSQFISLSIAPSLFYTLYMAFMSMSPFYYREILNLGLVSYSFHIVVIIGCFALTSLFHARLIDILGENKILKAGMILSFSGLLMLFISSICLNNIAIWPTVSMGAYSIGAALCYPILFGKSLEIFPQIKGTATSLIMCLRTLMMAICLGAASSLFQVDTIVFTFFLVFLMGIILILYRNSRNSLT